MIPPHPANLQLTPNLQLTSNLQDPSLMTAAQKKAAALNTERVIYVTGGRGRKCSHAPDGSDLKEGKATIILGPGQGLTELKAMIKKTFGKEKMFRVR